MHDGDKAQSKHMQVRESDVTHDTESVRLRLPVAREGVILRVWPSHRESERV